MTISDLGLTTSKTCDLVIANSIGPSPTTDSDEFTYTPQTSGATNHTPNSPANSDKILYIIIAGLAAAVLVAVAVLMRRWDPGKREQQRVQAQEQPASNPPITVR
jgi:hypothetical protein